MIRPIMNRYCTTTLLILVATTLDLVVSKPRIVGEKDLKVYSGRNVVVKCWANKEVNWYKLIIKAQETTVIDEDSHTIHLEIPDYVDLLDDAPRNANEMHLAVLNDYVDLLDDVPRNANETHLAVLNLQEVNETESGTYVCVYQNEADDLPKIKKRISRNKTKLFSMIQLTVITLKPTIDNGDRIVVDPGQDVNMTCRGEKPVTWVFLTNHTSGVQHTDSVINNQHISVLELRNVNYTDVGYFVCAIVSSTKSYYDDFDHKTDPNTASTYLFVKDEDHLLTLKGFHTISSPVNTQFTIPCKPTFPEVVVNLERMDSVSVHGKYVIFAYNLQDGTNVVYRKVSNENFYCEASYLEKRERVVFVVDIYHPMIPDTNVSVGEAWQINSLRKDIHTYDIRERSVVMMNCTALYRTSQEKIMWTVPDNENAVSHKIHEISRGDRIQQIRLITDASSRDSGIYSCYVTNIHVNSSAYEFALNIFPSNSTHLELKAQSPNITLGRKDSLDNLIWIIYFRAYPDLTLLWNFEGEEKVIFTNIRNPAIDELKPKMTQRKEQYEIKVNWTEGEIVLKVHSPTVRNVGEYSLVAMNRKMKEKIYLRFLMEGPPEEVTISLVSPDLLQKKDSQIFIKCSAYGFPVPTLQLVFIRCSSFKNCDDDDNHPENSQPAMPNEEKLSKSTNLTAFTGQSRFLWEAFAREQGKYICIANNIHGTVNSSNTWLTITDSELEQKNYLQIEMESNNILMPALNNIKLIEDDNVTFICRGNNLRSAFPLVWNVEWGVKRWSLFGNRSFPFQGREIFLEEFQTKYSFISQIRTKISTDMDKLKLICADFSNKQKEQAITLLVTEAIHPVWTSKELNGKHFIKNENEQISFMCSGTGIPYPIVSWFKNGEKLWIDENEKRISIIDGNLTFAFVFPEDTGKYLCQIENRVGLLEDYFTLEVLDPDAASNQNLYISLGVIGPLFIIVVVYILIKAYKERRDKEVIRMLKEKVFMDGNPDSLNPDLDLGEQADLLPYDHKFEFPRQNLIIEKLIGNGAFGTVYKCTALGLVAGELKTTVAVKMAKSECDEAQMKTLRTELKIMIHIGRHVNIVNLLGAVSKDMYKKGELLLIAEYCRHGNILDYMRRHRSEYIDQINSYGRIDTRLRQSVRNKTSSRASFRTTYVQLDMSNTHSNDSWETQRFSIHENSDQNSALLFNGRRRVHSDSAAADENVNTDMTIATVDNSADNYVSETTLEQLGPFCTKTLLHWAFQIANGMFYLSERKVIHGDLAARNILLADRNVVKISDFGLSKNIYKQDNYKKKSKGPLPVKWLSLEAIRDNIFSTQSDVWSFGVVLWEIFSLGECPYTGIEFNEDFIQRLEDGYRLKQPNFATFDLFEVMEHCWRSEPNQRPTFRGLEKKLGDMLGETEKEMYMALNAPYEENNMFSEHLKRIRTPTYDSRAQSFFPSNVDPQGYEAPILNMEPGIFMVGTNDVDEVVPRLHPVPGHRKSSLTINLPSRQEERVSLMNSTDENYLVMSTPSALNIKPQHFTFETIPLVVKSPQLYQNIPTTDVHQNVSSTEDTREHLVTSSTAVIKMYDVDHEANDSVFLPSPKELQFRTSPKDLHSQKHLQSHVELQSQHSGNFENTSNITSINFTTTKPSQNASQSTYNRYKHESEVYFSNELQNNPLYSETSGFNNILNQNSNYQNMTPIENDVLCSQSKQRTQSDSSSGFGSLSEDKCNSLDKKGNIEPPSSMENVKKITV